MSEENKTRKRKLLTRYLILAACILVIAAITVTIVFAANNWFRSDFSIDQGGGNDVVDSGNTGNKGDDDDGKNNNDPDDGKNNKDPDDGKDDKPTTSDTTFACPMENMDVVTVFEFCKDVTLGHWHFHTGLDIAAAAGTDVMATLDGTVETLIVGDQLDGTKVVISHANGMKTVYSYIEAKEGLKVGDSVKRGEVIGTVAEPNGAEFKQGAHLHFEILENGESVDPAIYLNLQEK